ncbi:MAG: hypothetical protein FWH36_02195 [Lentimicrobiaceae bacterium]|nr:hypothetical protein [Lentimicrobiaceae bacterium]
MKKVVLPFVFSAGIIAVFAQPRAIGLHGGFGTEVSYQHSFGDRNMLQIDAGFPDFNAVQAAGTYNWVFPFSLWKYDGSWNWYAGVGAGVGLSEFKNTYFFIGPAGMIGVEYNFKFPLQLSLDWRPVVGLFYRKDDTGVAFSWAPTFGVRYKFRSVNY